MGKFEKKKMSFVAFSLYLIELKRKKSIFFLYFGEKIQTFPLCLLFTTLFFHLFLSFSEKLFPGVAIYCLECLLCFC